MVDFDYTDRNGLVLCANIHSAQNNAEVLYINEAQKLGVDAVLFRRYYNEGEEKPHRSEPAVCIFNKDNNFFNTQDHIKLHAALWSAAKNEIYIINCPSRQDIINARKPAELQEDGELSISNILMASSTAVEGINKEKFSAYLFGSGTFWEQPEFEKSLDEKNSPYLFLLDYLMAVREVFLSSTSLKLMPETIDKLLVTSILIKFLEDITDDKGKHTLRSIYRKYKITTFADAVDQGHCVAILNELANEFNGKIFDKFSDEEKEKINQANLSILANFLKANIDVRTNQMFIWEQYSFKHLPAEVISAIYENFIQAEAVRTSGEKEKGVVYTPIHLVNLLVDEVMPLDKPKLFENNRFTILDPACGSGVFLVAAFKRLLQWWAINNSTPSNIQYPDSKTAQKILEDNIFGVDVKKTATLVTIFSLTTALLDKLTPQEIWNNLKFRDLSQKNIRHASFFDWALLAKEKGLSFNLIIGNPPFNVETDKKKQEVLDADKIRRIDLRHKDIPGNNLALHFFEVAMLFSEKVCMIIPSSVLLYNRASQKYRAQIFTDYTIVKIFDFTHLRESLFTKKSNRIYDNQKKTGRTPVVGILVERTPSEKQPIEHIIVRRTVSTEKKIRFEIDYYDTHKVKWDWAVDADRSFIWKTNLLGGGRLFHFIYRLKLLPTLRDFIISREGWKEQRGYEGGNEIIIKNVDRIIAIKNNGEPEIVKSTSIQTDRLKDQFMYEAPFMIIDQVLGDKGLPTCIILPDKKFTEKNRLYYNRDFIGISAPAADQDELREVYKRISEYKGSLNYKFFIVSNSSSSLVLTETDINKSEILNIPYTSENEYLKLSSSEKILQEDVLNYFIHLGKGISIKSAGNILHQKANEDHLREYGATFCGVLNEIYAKNNKLWQIGSVVQTELYTICQFGFGKKGGLSYNFDNLLDDSIKPLVEDKLSNSGIIYTKVVRIYKHMNGYDCIFFIKPSGLRYWLKSIALRDGDDTFVDLKNAGF